jgi:hypothetical protein
VPRTQRSAPHLRRGVLQSRGPSLSRTESVGPGSAEQRCTLHRVRDTNPPDSRFNIQTAERHESALSRRGLRPSFASIALEKPRGRGECRMPAAPAASCAIGVIERTRVTTSTPESPGIPARNGFNGFLRALVSAKSARMCERAVLTNRPSLDLSPFVLEGREPDGERGTDPVSSSTRTVAWA